MPVHKLVNWLIGGHTGISSQLPNLCMDTFGTPSLQYVMSIVWLRSFIEPDLFHNNVPFDNITPIYLINLPWKSGLGRIRVRLRVALL